MSALITSSAPAPQPNPQNNQRNDEPIRTSSDQSSNSQPQTREIIRSPRSVKNQEKRARLDTRTRNSLKDRLLTFVGKNAIEIGDHLSLADLIASDKNAIFNYIKTELLNTLEYKNFNSSYIDIQLTETTLIKPSMTGSSITLGKIGIKVLYKGVIVTNNLDDIFTIEYGNGFLISAWQVLDKMNSNSEVALSDIRLPIAAFGSKPPSLGTLFSLFDKMGPLFNQLPTVIPQSFDNEDENWVKWNTFINSLFNTLKAFIPDFAFDLDTPFIYTIDPIFPIEGNQLKISGKVTVNFRALINSFLPTLINFRNFVNLQKEAGVDNLPLLLVKYLFAEPFDYRDNNDQLDEYTKINPNVRINHRQNANRYKFKSNLEVLLNNMFEGWTSKKNIAVSEIRPIVVDIKLENAPMLGTKDFKFKYQKDDENEFIGLKDWLPVDNIENWISEIFNADSTIVPKLMVKAAGIVDVELQTPFKSFFNDANLFALLKSLGLDSDIDEHMEAKWNSFKINILYQTSRNQNWVQAKKISDLARATNMKLVLKDNSLTLKSKIGTDEIQIQSTQSIGIEIDLKATALLFED